MSEKKIAKSPVNCNSFKRCKITFRTKNHSVNIFYIFFKSFNLLFKIWKETKHHSWNILFSFLAFCLGTKIWYIIIIIIIIISSSSCRDELAAINKLTPHPDAAWIYCACLPTPSVKADAPQKINHKSKMFCACVCFLYFVAMDRANFLFFSFCSYSYVFDRNYH